VSWWERPPRDPPPPSLQLSAVSLRGVLFCWVVVIPALSLAIAFIAELGTALSLWIPALMFWLLGLAAGYVGLLCAAFGMWIVIDALLGGNPVDPPPRGELGPLWMFWFCPLVLAMTSLVLGLGGHAVLRGERVDAVVEQTSKVPGEPSRMTIDRLSDPATKEVIDVTSLPLLASGNYEVGDRVPAMVVRGSDHPAVLVGRTSAFTACAAIWLAAWLTGLVGVVVILGPGGQRRRIARESNVEVRRVMMERYGLERYLRAVDATKLDEVHEPPFPGLLDARLWRADMAGDEPLCVVELVNSTPEPDGSARSYMLRVPPDVQTAHQAVAWTFGMAEREYAPAVES